MNAKAGRLHSCEMRPRPLPAGHTKLYLSVSFRHSPSIYCIVKCIWYPMPNVLQKIELGKD